MFVGVLLVISLTGAMQEDAAFYASKEHCEEAKTQIIEKIQKADDVLAYNVTCYDADTYLTIKKLTPEERKKALKAQHPVDGVVEM